MGEQAGSALLYSAFFSAVGAMLPHSGGGHRPGAADALTTGFRPTHTIRNRVNGFDSDHGRQSCRSRVARPGVGGNYGCLRTSGALRWIRLTEAIVRDHNR